MAVLIFLSGIIFTAVLAARLPAPERRIAAASYVAHLAGALGQVWLHTSYYQGGDMVTYLNAGRLVARLVDMDPGRFAPELVKLFLHVEPDWPIQVHGVGSSSGTVVAFAGALVYVLGGSLVTVCLLMATSSSLAQLVIHRTCRDLFEPQWRATVGIGLMLVPSVTFWSSALTKEALALPFLALLIVSSVALARRRWSAVVGVAIGAGGVGLIKAYILLPFILAVAAAAYVSKNSGRTKKGPRWPYFLLATAIAFLGIAVMSVVFPDYAPGSLAESAAQSQRIYADIDASGYGGSNFDLGEAGGERSLARQLAFVPMAAVNAWFRPFLFEARNIVLFGAALETTAATFFAARLLLGRGRRRLREVLRSPALAFCTVFVFTFGIAVGLTTFNLGTLSRYRTPMMPFFAVALLVICSNERPAAAPVPAPQNTRRRPPLRSSTRVAVRRPERVLVNRRRSHG